MKLAPLLLWFTSVANITDVAKVFTVADNPAVNIVLLLLLYKKNRHFQQSNYGTPIFRQVILFCFQILNYPTIVFTWENWHTIEYQNPKKLSMPSIADLIHFTINLLQMSSKFLSKVNQIWILNSLRFQKLFTGEMGQFFSPDP